MPFMRAPYASEIRSLTGHVLVAQENEVLHVPEEVVPEAVAKGWQPADAPGKVEAPAQLSDNVTDSPSDDAVSDQVDLDQAVMRVITRNVESDFKGDGVPKLSAVVAELPKDAPRPTAGKVLEAFERLQSNINLAED